MGMILSSLATETAGKVYQGGENIRQGVVATVADGKDIAVTYCPDQFLIARHTVLLMRGELATRNGGCGLFWRIVRKSYGCSGMLCLWGWKL